MSSSRNEVDKTLVALVDNTLARLLLPPLAPFAPPGVSCPLGLWWDAIADRANRHEPDARREEEKEWKQLFKT